MVQASKGTGPASWYIFLVEEIRILAKQERGSSRSAKIRYPIFGKDGQPIGVQSSKSFKPSQSRSESHSLNAISSARAVTFCMYASREETDASCMIWKNGLSPLDWNCMPRTRIIYS